MLILPPYFPMPQRQLKLFATEFRGSLWDGVAGGLLTALPILLAASPEGRRGGKGIDLDLKNELA